MEKSSKAKNRREFIKRSGLALMAAPLTGTSLGMEALSDNTLDDNRDHFEFSFLTDIHIKPGAAPTKGFQMAIDKVNALRPDFVLTGGDLAYDTMRGDFKKSEALFELYTRMCRGFKMPVHQCLGNHDLFAIYAESPEGEDHPDYKYGMWERYFGNSYYSFDHKGWHFITLNSLDTTAEKRYRGYFHEAQLTWLAEDLAKVDPKTPIVITTHIPMVSTRGQFTGSGAYGVSNAKEVFDLCMDHNLKLILQGHIHWKEYGEVNDRFAYVVGGSIAGNGWKGRRHNCREGFVHVKVRGDDFSWEYIDHGWEKERLAHPELYKIE